MIITSHPRAIIYKSASHLGAAYKWHLHADTKVGHEKERLQY